MSKNTASQIRYEKAVRDLARERFYQNPQSLPEAIAKHYCANAMIALQLAEAIKLNKRCPSSEVQRFIGMLAHQIKENHIADFGTELVDTVSPKAKAWARYIEELDGVE